MEVISARQAFERGLTRYFTGKPCGHGHISERMISNGVCVQCLNERRAMSRKDAYERTKVWRLQHPEARTEEARRYRAMHPDKCTEKAKRYRAKNLEKVREQDRLSQARLRAANPEKQRARYEAWRERKEDALARVAGRRRPEHCELCGGNKGGIAFDHCHQSGSFRGWICDRCNKVLGLVYDSPRLLRDMANYLEKAKNVQVNNGTAQEAACEDVCSQEDEEYGQTRVPHE